MQRSSDFSLISRKACSYNGDDEKEPEAGFNSQACQSTWISPTHAHAKWTADADSSSAKGPLAAEPRLSPEASPWYQSATSCQETPQAYPSLSRGVPSWSVGTRNATVCWGPTQRAQHDSHWAADRARPQGRCYPQSAQAPASRSHLRPTVFSTGRARRSPRDSSSSCRFQ